MNWPLTRLKFVATFRYGDALPKDEIHEGIYPVFGSNGQYSLFNRPNTEAPAVIIGRKGSYGKVNWSTTACYASDTTFFIDNSSTHNELRWIYWLLQTLDLDTGTDEAAVPGLNREAVYAIHVPMPPREAQRAIAVHLDRETDRIDVLIRAKERALDLLVKKRRALTARAVTQGLDSSFLMRDSGIPWLGPAPAHWEVKKLGFVASLKSGEMITADEFQTGDPYPVYGGNGIRGYTSDYNQDGEYVLIGRQGALCGNINYASGKFWASEHAVVVNPLQKTDIRWLGELLTTMNLNQYSASAAQPGLSVESISELRVPVPPFVEQQAIASYIFHETAKLDALGESMKRSVALLKERRASLIVSTVTGQTAIS